MKSIAIITLVYFLASCKDTSVGPGAGPMVWLSTDRANYQFTTGRIRDTMYLTLHNDTDTSVLRWWPTELLFKSDSGWVNVMNWDGQFPIVQPRSESTVHWFIQEYPFAPFRDGIYQIVAEAFMDTVGVKYQKMYRAYSGELLIVH